MSARNDASAPFAAFLAGSLTGIALGLLFAPRSGQESRDKIKQKARENLNKMQTKVSQGQEAARGKIDQAMDTTDSLISNAADAADSAELKVKEQRVGKHSTL